MSRKIRAQEIKFKNTDGEYMSADMLMSQRANASEMTSEINEQNQNSTVLYPSVNAVVNYVKPKCDQLNDAFNQLNEQVNGGGGDAELDYGYAETGSGTIFFQSGGVGVNYKEGTYANNQLMLIPYVGDLKKYNKIRAYVAVSDHTSDLGKWGIGFFNDTMTGATAVALSQSNAPQWIEGEIPEGTTRIFVYNRKPANAAPNVVFVQTATGGGIAGDVEALKSEAAALRTDVDDILKTKPMGSRLNGLKLVTAGDSITAGEGCEGGAAMDVNDRPTYGYIAKEYYGMEYLNIAMSGRTMADVKVNGVSRNGFAVERYALVPNDTDVLTIWFGYNDNAYGARSVRDDYCLSTYGAIYNNLTTEQKTAVDAYKSLDDWLVEFIGSKSSTDPKTWSGAWYTVFEHFVMTQNIGRIGVVLPYGVDERMIDILKYQCGKYGVPFIDAANPNEILTVGYSNTPFAKATHYRNLFTSDGLHPNNAGYERIARGYIPWLERI